MSFLTFLLVPPLIKTKLWKRHVKVIEGDQQLRLHLPILEALSPEGMSSDESDHYIDSDTGEVIHEYKISGLPW
ncbi:hypothetical protein JB92DRAFT_2692137 [Gautieria morchelliformis]|nr:hypothetical protein JB92DRAFT_2692137 [Gautieria morchelliformis]